MVHYEGEAIAGAHPDLLSDSCACVTTGAPHLSLDADLADRLTWRDYPGHRPDQCLRTNGHRSTSQDPDPEESFCHLGEHGEPDDQVSPRVGDDKDGQQNGDGDEHDAIVAAAEARRASPLPAAGLLPSGSESDEEADRAVSRPCLAVPRKERRNLAQPLG